jgi:alkanesulfonate monooxygenase SsuD/methylene tetrahydromethanopterin reductase-like flavin-dependent oxidoreductase (luciferase family)
MASHGILLPTRNSVMTSDDAATLAAKTQYDVVGLAQRAESLGFDSVWVGDSVLAKPRHEPLTTIAALGTATDSITLGTAVYLPALRHPVHVAHMATTVDQLCGGRLVLGVGTGSAGDAGSSVEHEYAELGVSWDQRGAVIDEQLDLITRLTTDDSVEYSGDFFDLEGEGIGFQPCGDLPMYVGSTVHPEHGIVRAIRTRIAQFGSGWVPVMASPDSIEFGLEQIESTMAAHDRDSEDLEVVLYQDIVVAESEQAALEKERQFVQEYYPGMNPSNDELRRRGAFGPPERIRDTLDAYERAGVDHFITRFPTANQHRQLDRFQPLLA